MCGINGITRVDPSLVEQMNQLTQHRGPDGSRVWSGKGITLGQNRLAIIDLSDAAAQPFVSGDGRYVAVFNGEIYNYRELRDELRSSYSFRTQGDTEVLVAAYALWGAALLPRLRGIFAFGIWDTQTESLFLARDQVGVKPLYYRVRDDQALLFSSEAKALLGPGERPRLQTDSFQHHQRLLYVPGTQTLFDSIKRLPPGSYLTVTRGEITQTQYYSHPPAAVRRGIESETSPQKQILTVLDQVTRRQLVADVPVGVYLSGGVDSTAVLDAVVRAQGTARTFSVAYELEAGEQADKFNADATIAEKTARHYGTTHYTHYLQSADVPRLLEEHVWHLDEPVANLTALAQYELSRIAKQSVTVVLGGDGGDEIFGGYKRHQYARWLRYYWALPRSVRRLAPARLRKTDYQTWSERYLFFLAQKDTVITPYLKTTPTTGTRDYFAGTYFSDTRSATFLDDMMNADLSSWLVDESLLRTDKMAMAHGLEQRVPLLDVDMIALSRGIAARDKVTLTTTKKVFRDALRGRVPEWVLSQPKRGWISPGAKWLRRPEVRSYLKSVLSRDYYDGTRPLFRFDVLEQMYDDHCAQRAYHLTPLWSVMIFQIWARRFGVVCDQETLRATNELV